MAKFGRFITGLVLVGSSVGAGIGDGSPMPANGTMATEGRCAPPSRWPTASAADTTITLTDANSVPNNPSSIHARASQFERVPRSR